MKKDGDRLTTDFHRNFPANGVFFSRQEGVVNMRLPNGDKEDLQLKVECETRTVFNDGESVSIYSNAAADNHSHSHCSLWN